MNEELAIELLKTNWNFTITTIILVAVLGGFLIIVGAIFVRNMGGDNIITRCVSYGLTVCSLIAFGIAGYFAFGGFYL